MEARMQLEFRQSQEEIVRLQQRLEEQEALLMKNNNRVSRDKVLKETPMLLSSLVKNKHCSKDWSEEMGRYITANPSVDWKILLKKSLSSQNEVKLASVDAAESWQMWNTGFIDKYCPGHVYNHLMLREILMKL